MKILELLKVASSELTAFSKQANLPRYANIHINDISMIAEYLEDGYSLDSDISEVQADRLKEI